MYYTQHQKRPNARGFTLIELLVVIAIIGILSSVVLASMASARAKSRDATRMRDLRELQKVVELYYTKYGAYPSTSNAWWGGPTCTSYGAHPLTGPTGWIPNVSPEFMPQLSQDPKPTGTGGCYLYRSNGKDYMIMTHGTVETFDPDTGPHPLDRLQYNQQSISVYSAGAKYW